MSREGLSETAEAVISTTKPPAAICTVLLVVRDSEATHTRDLSAGCEVVIGRRLPSDVVVSDCSVSAMHLRVRLRGGHLVAEDLSSRNGTFLDGQPLAPGQAQTVQPGQTLRFGAARAFLLLAPSMGAGVVSSLEDLLVFLRAECARAEATGTHVAVLALRTFKRAGTASYLEPLRATLRAFDQAASYSTDRTLVVCPGCSDAHAEHMAHEILAAAPAAGLGIGIAVASCGADAERAVAHAQAVCQRTHSAAAVIRAPALERTGSTPPVAAASTGGAPEDEPVARSASSLELFARAKRAARAPVTVLVLGETGTGKEVVARYLHRYSPRADGPLVAVNCGAIAPSLLSSTLFGHVRGAFTGATETKPGLFEQAHGGTLFLDEVGELSPDAQVSLLRTLETERITRVGGSREQPVDVRVIAATHRDLEQAVSEGGFREDLLYRLNAVTLHITPLRERRADLRPLCQALLARIAQRWRVESVPAIADATYNCLETYSFPGNVRELRNILEHALVSCEGNLVTPSHLPDRVRQREASAEGVAPLVGAGLPFRQRIERYEIELIREALTACAGNQSQAAEALRIPRRTLVHKLRAYGLQG